MISTNRKKLDFYTSVKFLCLSTGFLLTQSTCFYSTDKYTIDPKLIRCESLDSPCPDGQICDVTRRRCVEKPNVKLKLQVNLAPFASVDLKLNEQACSAQQPCEVTWPIKNQVEATFTPNDLSKLVSVRNERGEAATCENNRCVIPVGEQDETWTATVVNPTFCSSDNWCQTVMNTNFSQIWSPDGQKLIAIGSNGLVVSSMDGGDTWRRYVSKGKEDWRHIFGSADGQKIYVVDVYSKLLSSKDMGQTWSLQEMKGLTNPTGLSGTADGQQLYATRWNSPSLYLSSDGGQNWIPKDIGAGMAILWDVLSSADGKKLYVTSDQNTKLFLSSDGGQIWSSPTYGIPLASRLWSTRDGQKMYAVGMDGNISFSKYAGLSWDWQSSNNVYPLLGIAGSHDGQKMYAVSERGTVLYSTSQNWVAQTSGTDRDLTSIVSSANGENAYAVGSGGLLLRSTNSGRTWNTRTKGLELYTQWNIAWNAKEQNIYAHDGQRQWFASKDQGRLWENRSGPNIDTRFESAFTSSDGQRIYAVGSYDTLLMSSDGGRSWTSRTTGLKKHLRQIVGSANGQKLYITTQDNRVLYSDDYGQSWVLLESWVLLQYSLNSTPVLSITEDGSKVYAVFGNKSLLFSTDNGQSWSSLSSPPKEIRALFHSADGQKMYAIDESKVFVSSNAGVHWDPANTGMLANPLLISGSADGQHVYVITKQAELWESHDSGANWAMNAKFPKEKFFAINSYGSPLVSSRDGQSLYLIMRFFNSRWSVVASTDNRQTWSLLDVDPSFFHFSDTIILAMNSNNQSLFAMDRYSRIWNSNDLGKTWNAQTCRNYDNFIDFFEESETQTRYVLTRKGVLCFSRDQGQTWSSSPTKNQYDISRVVSSTDKQKFYGIGGLRANGIIFISDDRAQTWKSYTTGVSVFLFNIVASEDGQKMHVVGEQGTIVSSENGGQTWTKRVSGTTETLHRIVQSNDGQKLYAVGDKGIIVSSHDGGQNWKVQSSGVTNNLNQIWSDVEGRKLYVVGDRGLLLASEDSGQTWKQETSGVTESLLSIAGSPDGKTICVGGDQGTFLCKYQ